MTSSAEVQSAQQDIQAALRTRMIQSGEYSKIMEALRSKLDEAGWEDRVRDLAREKARGQEPPNLQELVNDLGVSGPPGAAAETPQQHFVGTPDYLAPESILGVGMDAGVDWWALGVIAYEFLYGIPPFHDETPEKVFENILSRKLEWHEDVVEISTEARDFINRLLVSDSARRLGVKGAEEVKAHPFLDGVDWDNLLLQPVDFVPQVNDPESTDYFDPRGATGQEDDYKEKDAEAAEEVATSGDTALADNPAIRQMQPVPTPFSETVEPIRAPRDR
ncbi:hypothetical protein B0A53_06542, partial [Rhodotorula sp. CCFEE 5036]